MLCVYHAGSRNADYDRPMFAGPLNPKLNQFSMQRVDAFWGQSTTLQPTSTK